ncbi:glycosyltransferase family 4 protein [Holophaga foetida]|uniref:glycosyltransferase family 4 protein n=1 Tax=Holophaga foetida TaxID=35839 RepID=UPI0002473B79|nr:glycosyltransferase family 4 protein [Holophaga foetida]
MLKKVAYLCLQATKQGQASYAHVNEIIDGLRRNGVEVQLFEPANAEKSLQPGIGKRLFDAFWVQFRLIWHIRTFDLLYIRGHFLAFPASIAARLFRVPQVREVNGPYEDIHQIYPWTRPIAPLIRGLSRLQNRLAGTIITVTPEMAKWCKEDCGHASVEVVPNGANLDIFHAEAHAPSAPLDAYAIFFGAFSPWQGIDVMLKAVEHPEWPSNVCLLLAGDGLERPKVESAANRNERVRYLGTIPYRELPGFVAPALVGLCVKDDGGTHTSTGWSPLKLYEMMATGIPVVVTDLPGQREIVEKSRSGLVIQPGDPAELARAVASLASNPALAKEMGSRGLLEVRENHSWARRANDTLGILQETFRRARSA